MIFDFKQPDYVPIIRERIARLRRIRAMPGAAAKMKEYYRDNPIEFIDDWGCTFDPRNIERGLPAVMPFIPFDRQRELMQWFYDSWKGQRPGVVPKSRDIGASWCFIAWCITMGLHNRDFSAGVGSRKEEYVDKTGSPKALFWKGRTFLELLPPEFRGGWEPKHAPHMRISIPDTGSVITGEAGNNIGRGDRTSIYGVDEAAHIERPDLIEASLSATTNCRIDMSSVNGPDNPFARKCMTWPPERVFTFHWRDDPRKDDAWYRKVCVDIDNPIIVAQEIDINFNASREGVLIPSEWVQAAVNAHVTLGIEPTGNRIAGMDVADEGKDKNALAGRHGIVLRNMDEWTGVGSDIYQSVERAFRLCGEWGYDNFNYDADGLGAGVRGDARMINKGRQPHLRLRVAPYRGSESPIDPDEQVIKADGEPNGRTNADYFKNRKAQAWWALRTRFQRTYRAVIEKLPYDPDEIISIDPNIPDFQKVVAEFSQPTYAVDGTGKIVVNKAPPGSKSPNHADAVVIAFAPQESGYDLEGSVS